MLLITKKSIIPLENVSSITIESDNAVRIYTIDEALLRVDIPFHVLINEIKLAGIETVDIRRLEK